jgi:hypothetical protein
MYKIIGADGQEYGPVSTEQLRQWIAEGRVNLQTRAQAAGTTEWKALGQYPEFAVPGAVPPPAPGAYAAQPRPQISNHLVPAILTTIFCCLPFGIAAIVFAAQVNTKLAAGDIAGAQESARKAKMWSWLSFGVGIVVMIIWFVIAAATGFSSVSHY